MRELRRTNDPVYLSWAIDLLRQEGFSPILLDQHMSVLEGSINALEKRIMIADDEFSRAEKILTAAEAIG